MTTALNTLSLRAYVATENAVIDAVERLAERARDEEGAELVQVGIVMAIFAVVTAFVVTGVGDKLKDLGQHVIERLQDVISRTGG